MTKTLLVLPVVFVVACGGEPEVQAASVASLSEATYAGRTANPDLFAAVVTGPNGLEAYFCDNQKDFWFRGSAGAPVLELTDGRGATLVIAIEGGRAVGRIVEGETAATTFDLGPVTGDVLFRSETAAGETPVLGGWIRLPDGEQRGAVRIGDATFASQINPALEATCVVCGALALAPAAYTPAAVQKRPNVPARFTVIALGDSMMAGEGAPVVLGNRTDNGTQGPQETWSNGLPTPSGFSFVLPQSAATLASEAKRCHRGAAGAGIAVNDLRASWPRVTLIHQSFACSGARTDTMVTPGTYSGPGGCGGLTGQERTDCLAITDDLSTPVPSQTATMRAFLNANALTADAVLMSIGVNNLGFSKIIADCIANDCSKSDSEARSIFANGEAALPAAYQTLAGVLTGQGVLASNVYISKYPNPMRRTNGDLCNDGEFDDYLLSRINDDEATFANSTQGKINDLVANGATAAGWKLIQSHIGTEGGHGICSSAPWFNDTKTALQTQGEDLMPQTGGLIHLSAGMVHPNQAGQRDMYAPAWKSALDATLRTRFTPKRPTDFKAIRFEDLGATGFRVTLTWNDVNLFESQTTIRGTGDLGSPSVQSVGFDATTMDIIVRKVSTGTPKVTLFLKACFQTGSELLCSPETAGLEIEVVKPTARPTNVAANVSLSPLQPGIRLTWVDEAPSKIFSTVEIDIGGVVTRSAVEGQQILLPESTDLKRFRVATCNTLGCTAPSAWAEFQRNNHSLPPPCVAPQQSSVNGNCR